MRVRDLVSAVRRRPAAPSLAGPALLDAFAEQYPEATFVEIGSNDGEQHDFLRPHILERAWRGVMVEPVPYVFERLRRNYAGLDRVALENAAIADRDGVLPFFHLAEADAGDRATLPSWYDGIGSFSREAVLSHAGKVPDLERRLVRREVPALTFASLCARHGLDRIDLLVVDVEGYDRELLRHVDLGAYGLRLVVYEHFHLGREDRADCRAQLEAAGFATVEEGFDTFCLRTDPQDALTAAWRALRPGVAGVYAEDEPR